MFGGLCFMVNGSMCCGLDGNDLMVRVGPARHAEALARPHVRPMDITARPLTGFVFVAPAGYRTDAALAKWVKRGVDYALTIPPKKPRRRRRASPRPRVGG